MRSRPKTNERGGERKVLLCSLVCCFITLSPWGPRLTVTMCTCGHRPRQLAVFLFFLAESWSIANMCCCLLLPLRRRCWLYSSSRTNSQTCVDSTDENRRKGKDAGTQKLNSARIWPCPLSDSCELHTLHDQASARVQKSLVYKSCRNWTPWDKELWETTN